MNLFYCCLFVLNILIVLAKPDQIIQQNPDEVPAFCSSPECLYFKGRLDTLEAVVQKMASVLLSKKSPIFAPISRMLELDPTVKLILSRSTLTVPPNSTISATDGVASNSNIERDAHLAEESSSNNEKEMTVGDLKGALKCSLANLVDINTIGYDRRRVNLSAPIKVSFLADESLGIEWSFPSTECIQFSSGVWIQVFQFGDEHKSSPETSLFIPLECLETSSANSFSITLPPPTSFFDNKNDTCRFLLNRNLIQCRSYIVEVIPNYQSFRGNTLRKEIVIQPKKIDESRMKSLVSIVTQSDSLMLNWEDNSGCAPQMTSFDLKIFPDGIVNKNGQENKTIRIPSSCLKRTTNEENFFSFTLPANPRTCSVDWEPLDKCRKYGFEMNSQYSDTWNGPSSSWEIFTGQDEGNETKISEDYWQNCPEQQYYCPNYGCVSINSYVCDGGHHCNDVRDEKYCDRSYNCASGFKCGRQCIPKELVCDGKFDCLDLSDEGYNCNYKQICYQLTNPSGRFASQILVGQASDKDNVQVQNRFIKRPTRKAAVLISVQPNYQIWLSFDKFNTNTGEAVKVYDGPYATSPLLLSHTGPTLPLPIRSSSSDLFIEFPSYQNENLGFVSAYYTSFIRKEEPYVPGCGGYVSGRGEISTPNYSLINSEVGDCVWFIETSQGENTILLRRNYSLDNRRPPAVALISRLTQPPIIVYDGWNTSGQVLYDSKGPDSQDKSVVFSISNKLMVQFKTPTVKENNFNYSWNVSQISTPQCKHSLEATSGTIKSPKYPMPYPHMTDCRWNIKVKEGSTIRLLFAFIETEDGADIVHVYDGPSVYSKLLFAKSGSVPTPFFVNSSTNQVLIRFSSDDSVSFPGFLAVYSSI